MARAGLGTGWTCLMANDFDYKKGETYARNWGAGDLVVGDVRKIKVEQLSEVPDLVWGSFPCQDLSLAGGGAGLKGERSGTFWPFWKLMTGLVEAGRTPRMIVLENVCGALTSHEGKDFAAICEALRKAGFSYGALVIDAAKFVPQSRPRLFVIAVSPDCSIPAELACDAPEQVWHTRGLVSAFDKLSPRQKEPWLWWSLPLPTKKRKKLSEVIEENPPEALWHDTEETEKLLGMMSDANLKKVRAAQAIGTRMVGCIYRRTRREGGMKVQRAEVRFDGVAGCLRTPGGGSSRQILLIVEGSAIRSRLISSRETARLMGLPDSYKLPERYNEAYHLTGDGVAVPVVRHLARHILEPLLEENSSLVVA